MSGDCNDLKSAIGSCMTTDLSVFFTEITPVWTRCRVLKNEHVK